MKRVCTACHAVQDIENEICPRCGGNAVSLDEWRVLRANMASVSATPKPARKGLNPDSIPSQRQVVPTPVERTDGTAFVLGVFLSFLCFAIAFITAYVVIDWIR